MSEPAGPPVEPKKSFQSEDNDAKRGWLVQGFTMGLVIGLAIGALFWWFERDAREARIADALAREMNWASCLARTAPDYVVRQCGLELNR